MDTSILGTLLLLIMYFLSGFVKITNLDSISKGLKNKISFPIILCKLSIILVIILEICAPVLIIYSLVYRKYTYYSYIATNLLIVFTIIATILYHFPTQPNQYYYFMKNLSIIGGLLLLSNLLY
jgi:uncharacterized membrane protein YphA (DoxX/SURF4 family)